MPTNSTVRQVVMKCAETGIWQPSDFKGCTGIECAIQTIFFLFSPIDLIPSHILFQKKMYVIILEVSCPAIFDSSYLLSRQENYYGIQINYTCVGKFNFINTTRKTYKLARCHYDGTWQPPLTKCERMMHFDNSFRGGSRIPRWERQPFLDGGGRGR